MKIIEDMEDYEGDRPKIWSTPQPCHHPEHDPPGMMVYPPGIYEHTCPGCGHVTRFRIHPLRCTTHLDSHP